MSVSSPPPVSSLLDVEGSISADDAAKFAASFAMVAAVISSLPVDTDVEFVSPSEVFDV